jgi:16S rRNA (adenine(1408)-N(1))-methyltransferase
VGVDAVAAGLRLASTRAERLRLPNLLFVRAAVEDLPPALAGLAQRVSVILPWGSLLAACARPIPALLANIRRVCAAGASLSVVLAVDPDRDRAELARLGVPVLDEAHLGGALVSGYAAAGFERISVRVLPAGSVAKWPSAWARRLAFGQTRRVVQIDACAGDTSANVRPRK